MTDRYFLLQWLKMMFDRLETGDSAISGFDGFSNVVLSHFHPDHMGNIGKLNVRDLYVSKETFRHLPKDMNANIHIVADPVVIGSLHCTYVHGE